MRRTAVTLVAAAGLLALSAARAAAFEAAALHVDRFAAAAPATGGDPAVERRLSSVSLSAAYPAAFNDGRTHLVYGLAWRRLSIAYPAARPPPEERPGPLHALQVRFALAQRLGSGLRVIVYQEPGLFSDLEQVDAEHVRLEGGALVERDRGGRQRAGLGLSYTSTGGEPALWPYATYAYEGERVQVDLVVPSDMQARVRLGAHTEVGAAVRVTGAEYRIGAEDGVYDALRYSVATAGLHVRVRPVPVLVVAVEGGRTLRTRFEPRRDGRAAGVKTLEDAAYVRASLLAEF